MTANNGMRLVHPGEILRDELQALWLSANALSKALDAPMNRITATLHGQRGVAANTAVRLARYFGTTPQVWLNLQKTHEMRRAKIAVGHRIAACVKPWCTRQRRPGVAGSGQSRVDADGRSGRVTTTTPRSVSAPDVLRGNGSR